MNAENEEPKTDLELGLNYSNQCIWKNLKIDSGAGAGANAASRVDMQFVATGPLSELVWSPDKGLSLKCADSSIFNQNASHFWDVGPSNMILAAPESAIGVRSTTDIPIDDVLVKSVATEYVKSDIAGTDIPTRHPTKNSGAMPDCKEDEVHDTAYSDNIEKMNTAESVSNLHNDQMKNLMSSWEKNICNQANTGGFEISERKENKISTILGQVDKRPFDYSILQADDPKPCLEPNPPLRGHTSEGRENGIKNQEFETDDVFCSKVEPIIECKGSGAPGTNLTSFSKSPIKKLESTAENDLQTFNGEPAGGATSRVIVSKSNKIKTNSQDNEMMLLCDKNLSVVHSPSNSKIHMLRNKGKEKALSDGDTNVKLSNDEDDSHESVESCNSAELFSTVKKRGNFQQQLIVGSKRVKKQIEESSGFKSLIKQDSSFMNWISNMMKGFSKTIQIEERPLTLTLAHSDHVHQWPDQKHIIYNKNKDPERNSTGFQSIFQSIYCPSLKNVGKRMLTVNHIGEGSKDFEPGSKVHGIDANPITCCALDDVLYKQNMQSNELQGSTGGCDAGQSSQPKIEPLNFVSSHESSKNDSVENKSCSNLALDKEKEGMTSNSSSGRQNTNNTENIDPCELSDRKEADKNYRSDILGSLWITRFSPKSTSHLINSNHLNQSGGTQVHYTNCSTLPPSHKQIAYQNKSKTENSREQFADDSLLEAYGLQSCSINKEASIGPKHNRVNTGHKSMYEFDLVSPYPSNFFERQNSDVPKRIFDAVKNLCLSRTDILKWMNSDMPISQLDGFFLRIRLGKWEEGLGGTGYYVASINEAQRESSGQSTGKSLSVNVGGIKCMVESQYISNHEFLEEEIMAWWCTTSKAGDNVPSEADLIEKIKKKKMLGF